MTAVVEPFPTSRQAGRVMQAADIMDKLTARGEASFDRRVMAPLARELAASGISAKDIAAELESFRRAVTEEIFRRVAREHEHPEGGAA